MPTPPKVPLPGAPEYQPYEVPESVETPQPPVPPPQGAEPIQAPRYGFGRGAGGVLGTVAFLSSNILQGYAKGKAYAQQKAAMNAKRVADGLHGAYEMAAKNYYSLYKARIDAGKKPTDPDFMTPELQQAAASKDASWAAMMKYMSVQVMGPDGGKKKGKKGQQGKNGEQTDPMAALQSPDPQERARAWLAIATKVGPDVDIQTRALSSRAGMAETQYEAQHAENLAKAEDLKKQLTDAELQDTSQMTDADRQAHADKIAQLRSALADMSAAPGKTGVKVTAPRQGKIVTGADLQKVYGDYVPGANGPIKLVPGDTYYPIFTGEDAQGNAISHFEPATVAGQLKTTADTSGQPVQRVFNPYTKSWESTIGALPQKAQFIKIKTRDAKGNEVDMVVPFMPQYKHQLIPPPAGYRVDQPIDVGSEGLVKSGAQVLSGADIKIPQPVTSGATDHPQPPTQSPAQPERAKPSPATPAPTSAAPTPTPTPTPANDLDPAEQAARAAGLPPGSRLFQGYSKTNADKGTAIAAQELTLNGKPGSTTDIGLRRATLAAMKNPKHMEKIAVAMRQLEDLTKTQAATAGAGADGPSWFSMLNDTWNHLPAVESAMAELSPEEKAYLVPNFFRAWTNAATLRSLQGGTGRPTIGMYAQLVNELPLIGVNVQNVGDATRILDALQDDIDVAKGRLPQDMQDELARDYPRTKEVHPPATTKGKKESDDDIMNRLLERHGAGTKPTGSTAQPAGPQ